VNDGAVWCLAVSLSVMQLVPCRIHCMDRSRDGVEASVGRWNIVLDGILISCTDLMHPLHDNFDHLSANGNSSAVDRTCFVPCIHNTYGDESFTAAGLRVWSTPPSYLRRDLATNYLSKTVNISVWALTDRSAL